MLSCGELCFELWCIELWCIELNGLGFASSYRLSRLSRVVSVASVELLLVDVNCVVSCLVFSCADLC